MTAIRSQFGAARGCLSTLLFRLIALSLHSPDATRMSFGAIMHTLACRDRQQDSEVVEVVVQAVGRRVRDAGQHANSPGAIRANRADHFKAIWRNAGAGRRECPAVQFPQAAGRCKALRQAQDRPFRQALSTGSFDKLRAGAAVTCVTLSPQLLARLPLFPRLRSPGASFRSVCPCSAP